MARYTMAESSDQWNSANPKKKKQIIVEFSLCVSNVDCSQVSGKS